MLKWFRKNSEDKSPEPSGGNKRITEEQKVAREEAKKLAQKAAEDAVQAKAQKVKEVREKAARSSAESRAQIMAEQKKKKRAEDNATGKILRDIISGRFLTGEGVIAHVPFLLFLCGIFLANISLGYKFENIERAKMKTERALEEVNAEYKTLMSDLESRLQQSRVEQDIKDLGLEQPLSQPILLDENGND